MSEVVLETKTEKTTLSDLTTSTRCLEDMRAAHITKRMTSNYQTTQKEKLTIFRRFYQERSTKVAPSKFYPVFYPFTAISMRAVSAAVRCTM
eukprot:5255861-Amphidinium_carterae.1